MKNLTKVVVLAVALLVCSAPAMADHDSTTLTNFNTIEFNGSFVTVSMHQEGGQTFLTFTWFPGTSGLVLDKGLSSIGWSADLQAISAPTGYAFSGSGNMDGFGSFETRYSQETGNSGYNEVTFVFAGLHDLADFGDFAVHVQIGGDCSGWMSTRTHNEPGSSSGCTTTTVPEPGSMGLLAWGMLGLAGVVVRRRLRG